MNLSVKAYPYPVLRTWGDDYSSDSRFDVAVEAERGEDEVRVRFRVTLKDDGLRDLILNRRVAEVVCHLESPQTAYRDFIRLPVPNCEVASDEEVVVWTIPSAKLSGRVSVCPFVVATQDIADYGNASFNSDYEWEAFAIDAGGVLAEGTQSTFCVDTASQSLECRSSIFVVTPNVDEKVETMQVVLGEDKIVIKLPKVMMGQFNALHRSGRETRSYLCAMMYAPALVRALCEVRRLRSSGEDDEETQPRWMRSLDSALKRLKGFGFESDEFMEDNLDLVETAEMLLEDALGGALKRMNESGADGDAEGDDE